MQSIPIAVTIAVASTLPSPARSTENRAKILNIDFSRGDALETSVWAYEEGFVRNKEKGFYVGEQGPTVFVGDGALNIVARVAEGGGAGGGALSSISDKGGSPIRYISGSIYTKQAWKCAKYEVVARMPIGRGLFPAIWLGLGGGKREAYGEVDIAEHLGRSPEHVTSTIYFGPDIQHLEKVSGRVPCNKCSTAWRSYSAKNDGQVITVAIDGKEVVRKDYSGLSGAQKASFTHPFRLKINLAVGGPYAGEVDEASLPARLQVKSVRIQELACKN